MEILSMSWLSLNQPIPTKPQNRLRKVEPDVASAGPASVYEEGSTQASLPIWFYRFQPRVARAI